ncbi:glyoxalase family protein [Stemphylium lycopersici]|nr:glyoxalase bleomycin resistance protein dioxygenase [Stemphylium lycopersici]RAR04843.1 glyoxalase family protein [Stemphylium lycopersici]
MSLQVPGWCIQNLFFQGLVCTLSAIRSGLEPWVRSWSPVHSIPIICGISVPTARFEEVTAWYLAALAPLGYVKQKDFHGHGVGLGPDRLNLVFYISAKDGAEAAATHVAFRCTDRETVEKFHEAALEAGGRDNGKPGWRHQYHPKYYAAFALDPVGFSCWPSARSSKFRRDAAESDSALTTSKATQTIAATDSHAVQTDAATISLWGMLPKARDEAYSRGVSDGKEQGHMQGIDHGKEIGMNEGLAVGFSQGHAEGLAKGLAQREDAEITRSLGMSKKAEYSSEITEGLKQEREDFQKLGHSFSNKVLQGGPIHENNDLSLTQESPESGDRKENTKAAVLSNDPFASIWQEGDAAITVTQWLDLSINLPSPRTIMLKRLSSKSSNRRSSSSSNQPQQSQPSSAQTLISLPYSPHSPAQPSQAKQPSTPRTSDQAPYPLARTSASSLSSAHTRRSSASAPAPRTYPKHPLSPPSPNIPYDNTSWTHHNQLLANLALKADLLDHLASLAERRWKGAEAQLPPSRRHEAGVFVKIPVLQDIHGLLRSIRKLLRKDQRWREIWRPRSPLLRYPAWGCCYAEAVGVFEGEGVRAWDVGVELDSRVEVLIGVILKI